MDASDRKKRAAEEAAEWWVVLQGEVSRSEREAYVDWLRESSVHVAEMLRVAQVHGALAQFKRWEQMPSDGSGEPQATVVPLRQGEHTSGPPQHSAKRSFWPVRIAWSVAATVFMAVALAALLLPWRGQVIETQRGERREVALADGSVVHVDPETLLRVNYESHSRRVVLERGRALFHVAKNAERPFLVRADGTTVRAVGTAFAVEQGPDAVVVTVAEGKVAVFPSHSSPAVIMPTQRRGGSVEGEIASSKAVEAAAHRTGGDRNGGGQTASGEILLAANEQITVAGSGTAAPVREVDSHRALAWAEGRLIFENESVEYAVAQFNRYNRIQISLSDAELARRPISGVFSASDPESFVAFIQTVAHVNITRDATADITIQATR
jgi:transmembrane sensor